MHDIKPEPRLIEENIADAVYNFFVYGLTPGSYTSFMLALNFDRAFQSAHPLLKYPKAHDEISPHECLSMQFNDLPEFMTGENSKTWPGYVHLDSNARKHIQSMYSTERVDEWRTYQAINNRPNRKSFAVWIEQAEIKRKEYEQSR